MASKNKQHKTSFKVSTVTERIPLVSVIIPMFNSAKFISQTLESLLYQTMKDFEVIVIDDCSTDNSVEVVEDFKEKFGGRLHIIKLKKNTGTPGLPRNVGIQFACGKYIAFLDSDDLYTKTALEELSGLAEKFQADVVHMDGTFNLWDNKSKADEDPAMTNMEGLLNKSNWTIWQPPAAPSLKEPNLDLQTIEQRLNLWMKFGYRWSIASVFSRRDFLVANQINFCKTLGAEDMLFNFWCLCLAEKLLCVPNITYIIRPRSGSISREKQNFEFEAYLHKWTNILKAGMREFDNIMSQLDFFKQNPNYRYAVIDFFFKINMTLHPLAFIYSKVPAYKLNDLTKKEFHSDDATFSAYLFNMVNVYRLQIMKLQQELKTLKSAK